MSGAPIDLDHNGTTPVDPEVLDAMLPWLSGSAGNPSSASSAGREAKRAVEHARGEVAALIGAEPDEIVFTSGGTESNNHALFGLARMAGGRHAVLSAIEHPAVTEVCRALEENEVWALTVVPVDADGVVDPEAFERALRSDTAFVSVMHSNNEIGTVQPVAGIAELARASGIPVHCDAAQSIGKVRVDAKALGVDLLTLAGHKFHAPKGTGALYIRRELALPKFMHGAGQERGFRAGTENVPGWVGLGRACVIAGRDFEKNTRTMRESRDRLEAGLRAALPDSVVHGRDADRLPNTLSIGFRGVSAGELVEAVGERVSVSAGAACHSGAERISHVLEAIGADPEIARGTIRLTTGKHTTTDQADQAVEAVAGTVQQIRNRR